MNVQLQSTTSVLGYLNVRIMRVHTSASAMKVIPNQENMHVQVNAAAGPVLSVVNFVLETYHIS